MFPCSLSTQDAGRAALLVRQSMTSLGTITPKVIARMIVKAIMPSATVAPKSCKLAFALLASSRRSEEHTSELQSQSNLVCRLLLEKKKRTSTSASYAKHDSGRRPTE